MNDSLLFPHPYPDLQRVPCVLVASGKVEWFDMSLIEWPLSCEPCGYLFAGNFEVRWDSDITLDVYRFPGGAVWTAAPADIFGVCWTSEGAAEVTDFIRLRLRLAHDVFPEGFEAPPDEFTKLDPPWFCVVDTHSIPQDRLKFHLYLAFSFLAFQPAPGRSLEDGQAYKFAVIKPPSEGS